jgi:hypothetical protein
LGKFVGDHREECERAYQSDKGTMTGGMIKVEAAERSKKYFLTRVRDAFRHPRDDRAGATPRGGAW